MAGIPLTELIVSVVGENRLILNALKEVEAAKEKALATGDNTGLQRELDKLASVAQQSSRSLEPLVRNTRSLTAEMRNLGVAVKTGIVSVSEGIRQYRALESQLKTQLATLDRNSAGHAELGRAMKQAVAEAKSLEGALKGASGAYKTDDLKRYVQALVEIRTARTAGLVSERDSLAQLKSLQSQMAQYAGSLQEGSAELRELSKVMAATAQESKRLEAQQDRLEQAFRADALRLYAGELRQIDASVRDIGFDKAAQEVARLTQDLKTQQVQLATNGREFNELGRVLQAAATQQERYQRAAEQAQRANNTAELRTYTTELRTLEAQLQDTAKQYGTLDAQQRALKYDPSGIRAYRTETELLGRAQQDSLGAFSRVGQGLTELKGKLEAAAQSAGTGTRQYGDLERLLQGVERATVATAQAQERSQQAYRAADLSRFTSELRSIEAAQKAGAITAEQAARAVAQLQADFRDYATSLGVAERELNTLAISQRDVATGAGNLATAQERATRSFDSEALRSFRNELETLLRAQREGGASFDQTARSVELLQARLREYGSSLATNSREQADLNRILELSDRALTDLGVAAERASKGFDPANVSTYGRELEGLQASGRELGSSLSGIEQELTQLSGSFREAGQDANLSARELEQLGSVERELEAATGRLAAEQSKLDAAFKADQLRQFRGELEQIVTANKNGVTSFEQTARAVEALQGRIKEFGSSTQLTVREQGELARVLGLTETATRNLTTAQERAGAAFVSGEMTRYRTELLELQRALEAGTIDLDGFRAGAERLSSALETSRASVERGGAAYLQYTRGLEGVDRSLAQAEGRVRTFGVASGVSAGIADQMQNVLFRFGAAGEAASVAMLSMSGSMAGAATSAKLLNLALAAGLVGGLIAVAVGLYNVVKGAVSFEQAQADVAKSTGASRAEINKLTDALQGISRATGTPTEDLLGLAAVAGQLGVSGTENIAKFVDTINKLAIATNITGEAGAEALSKFINLTKDASQSVGDSANLVGNVINALGSSLAATESDILHMAQRLGTLKASANLSQVEILGLSGGMVSLGLTAERAEVSTTKLFTDIAVAASKGGKELEVFARAAGLSVEEFTKLQKESPADAFLAVVEGLRAAKDAGQDLNPILTEITGRNTTMRNVLLTLVGGFDTLEQSMKTAGQEAKTQTSLQKELETRLNTVAGQASLLAANFRTTSESLGRFLAPIMRDTLKLVNAGVVAFGKLFSTINPGQQPINSVTTAFVDSKRASGEWTAASVVMGNTLTGLAQKYAGFQTDLRDTNTLLSESKAALAETGDNATGLQGALDKLSGATGQEGFNKVLNTLTSSLNQDGKNAMSAFADSTLAPILAQGKLQEAALLTVGKLAELERAALTAEQASSKAISAKLREELQKLIPQLEEAKGKLSGSKDSMAEGFADFNSGALVSAEGLNINETAVRNNEAEVVRLESSVNNLTAQLDQMQGRSTEVSTRLEALGNVTAITGDETLTTAEKAQALREELGLTGDAAGVAGGGIVQLGQLLTQQNSITRMTEEQARSYKDKLVELRDTYPEMTDKINPLIAATNTQIASFNEAGGAATDLGGNLEETGRTAGEMADNIVAAAQRGDISMRTALDSLTLKLRSLKAEKAAALASGDYDPADLNQLDVDIAEVTGSIIELEPRSVNLFRALEGGARAVVQPVSFVGIALGQMGRDSDAAFTTFREGAEAAVMAAAGFGPSANEAANATRAWGEAAYTSADAQRDMYASVVEANAQLKAQDAVLAQLGLAIATEETNRLASAQQLAADNASRATQSWRTLQETQDGYATTSRLTAEQMQTQTTVFGDVRRSLEEARNAYQFTGDAQTYASERVEILRSALDTLVRAGIDPSSVALRGLQEQLSQAEYAAAASGANDFSTSLQDLNNRAFEATHGVVDLAKGAETYKKNLEALRGVQEAFADGIALADIDQHIADLEEAAKGHGKLGEDARATIERLVELRTTLQSLSLLSSVADTIAATFDTTDAQANLEALNEKKNELLESGNYDGADLEAMNEDIAALEQSIGDSRKWEAAFSAISDGAEAAYEAIESGGSTSEAAFAALGAGVQQVGELFQDNSGVIEAWAAGASNALNSLAQGNFVGFVAGVFQSITGMIKANSDEWAQYETIVRESGKAVAEQFSEMGANGLEVDEKAYNQWVAAEKKRAEAHEKFIEDWKKREAERVEAMAKANREMAKLAQEAQQTLGDLRVGVNDARIDFAKANGADEGLVFISETILAIRQQSAEFNAEMQRITADKNAYITQYLLANPGASRGEAESAAEAIFGPQREALKQQFALTASTILIEGAEQAKELGLTQKEFYEAVLSGNTELLGSMTEGQRLAMVQFIELAQELGIELPKAITDAMANVNEAQGQAGEDLAQGQQESAQRQIDAMKEEKAAFTNAWSERSTFLKDKIATSTGETKAMYEEMFRVEQEAYLSGINERNGAINDANAAIAENDVGAIEARLKVVDEALKTATGLQKEQLLAERQELIAAIDEGKDGVGSAIEADAQAQVDSLNTGLQTLNSAWATRSEQLKNLIATSSGAAKAEYERQYREEGEAYRNAVGAFMTDLQKANQDLLDAQDKGADDFVAAQEEVGRREQEALNGVFTILRQVLGPDADVIIGMIQGTYDRRRAVYLAEGQATAEAAGQANQSELAQLDTVFATLREILGPQAQTIIDMIQNTYDSRAAAYSSGGDTAANAAQLAAENERGSIANINQLLTDILGEAAGPIKDLILRTYNERAAAHQTGATTETAAIDAASGNQRNAIANINQMLVDILGPAAAEPIRQMILAAYNGRAGAHTEGGAEAGAGAVEGGNTEAAGVDQGTATTSSALERRDSTLAALLTRDNLTPALRAQAQALQAEFISGANMTEAEIATAREKVANALIARDARVTELVGQGKTQAEAVRIADGELAETLRGMGEEVAGGATQGGVTAAGGITASQDTQLAAIERLKSSLVSGAAGIGGQVTPAIAAEHKKLMDAFIQGAQTSGGGIDAAERAQITAMEVYQRQLEARAGVITTGVTPAVGRAHEAISGAFGLGAGTVNTSIAGAFGLISGTLTNQGPQFASQVQSIYGGIGTTLTTQGGEVANKFGSSSDTINRAVGTGLGTISTTFGSASSALSAAIGRGYTLTTQAQTQGSSAQVTAVQRAAQVEEAQFRQQSATLVQAINNSKGAERDALIREYQALQQNHQRESSAIQGQYTAAGRAEADRIEAAFGGVATVTVAGGRTAVAGTRTAYGDMTSATQTAAGLFGGVLGDQKTTLAEKQRLLFDTQKDVMIARREVLRSITRQSYQLLAQENSHGSISVLVPALNTSGTRTSDAVVAMHEKIRAAITRQTELTRAALRAQATTLDAAASGGGVGATGDAGDSLESTSMQFASPFAPTVGAFAADGLPDYSSATGQVRAYAAATGTLLDLFDSNRTLSLTSTQERALTLNVSFTGFGAALAAPISLLERVATSMWESARFERETASINRETAELLRTNTGGGTYELTRRPKKRKQP